MKVGDLVQPHGVASQSSFYQLGIIIEGPVDKIFTQGPSLQRQVLVSWQDGSVEWFHVNNLEVINESG
jgi:hypothetical protein